MNPRHLLQRAPLLLGALILAPSIVFAAGNERIQSFSQAKKILEREIYADHRVTLYCGAKFDERKRVELPTGFMTPKHAARAERVEWALHKAALWDDVKDKLNQLGTSLSGGQQQRLCIARGVAVKPEVILLDEPCSALDPISTARIENLIDELKKDYTVVIVTHSMQQAARISDYTAFMYLGELIEFGPTKRIFMKPNRKETEDYITGRFG